MHTGDTVRHLTTGDTGLITGVTDRHAVVEFTTDHGPETITYYHGEISGMSGWVQQAEITTCVGPITGDKPLTIDELNSHVFYTIGILSSTLNTAEDKLKRTLSAWDSITDMERRGVLSDLIVSIQRARILARENNNGNPGLGSRA